MSEIEVKNINQYDLYNKSNQGSESHGGYVIPEKKAAQLTTFIDEILADEYEELTITDHVSDKKPNKYFELMIEPRQMLLIEYSKQQKNTYKLDLDNNVLLHNDNQVDASFLTMLSEK